MAIQGNSALINQICKNSGLSGSALSELRERLQKLSHAELQSELAHVLVPQKSQNSSIGLVVEKNPAEAQSANFSAQNTNLNSENLQAVSSDVPPPPKMLIRRRFTSLMSSRLKN